MTTVQQNGFETKEFTTTTLHGDTTRRTDISKLPISNFQEMTNPIDLTKEIKYFKILVDVDDEYRSNLIRTLEKVNKGYINLVYSLIKGHVLLTNLEQEKEYSDRKKGKVNVKSIEDRERVYDFKNWSDILVKEFDWFLKKAGRYIGDLSKYSQKLDFQQSDELEELSFQMQERVSSKLFYDLEKQSTSLDQQCINLLSKVSSCVQKLDIEELSEHSSSIDLKTINMDPLVDRQDSSSGKKSGKFMGDGKLLSSGSLSNLTLEAISPGKIDGNLSGLKSTKIIKPPKPKPPKSTISKASLMPARSYDDTKKKNQPHSLDKKQHNTVEKDNRNNNTISSLSNVENLFKRSSENKDSAMESQSDTKQSIYVSELNGRIKAMENAVGSNVTPFGFSNETNEIVIEELDSDTTTQKTLSAVTHEEHLIDENKKLKPNKDLIDISFAKKQNFSEIDNGGVSEGKILQISEIQQTFGPIDSVQLSERTLTQSDSIKNDSLWLDSKRVLDTRPLIGFESCVDKLDQELTEPDFEIIEIKSYLSKF